MNLRYNISSGQLTVSEVSGINDLIIDELVLVELYINDGSL